MKKNPLLPALCFFILLLPFVSQAQKKHKAEKYFVTTSGKRLDFKYVSLTADSVICTSPTDRFAFPYDSLAEYHHTSPRRAGRGILIGAGSAMLAGGLIGHLTTSSQSEGFIFSKQEAVTFSGILIGLPLGGLIGGVMGSSMYKNTHLDMHAMTKEEKRFKLMQLFTQ